ncbi:MAG: TIM barrel protein [Phycisphaeraceae bacterium]|nr:TIM barrel protein [Phycisphaeraceae bacterium]
MKINQSFCYPLFKTAEMSLDELCRQGARIGFAGIELWFRDADFDELCAAASAHGLAVASMCGHQSLKDGLNRRDQHDRIEAELRESIAAAVSRKIPNLICFSGNRNPGQSEEEALETCAAGLRRVAPEAERCGINLNVELLNSKVDHKGYQCDHTAWGVEMCNRVKSPRVKLLYDIYHMQIMEGDVIRTIRQHAAHIGHYHTAGNPGRNDLDQDQELNYPAICRAIAASGYTGFVAHEFTPKGDRMAALAEAFKICSVTA